MQTNIHNHNIYNTYIKPCNTKYLRSRLKCNSFNVASKRIVAETDSFYIFENKQKIILLNEQ